MIAAGALFELRGLEIFGWSDLERQTCGFSTVQPTPQPFL
jgi:hypothetical protein